MERLTKRDKEGNAYWNGKNGVSYSDIKGNIYGSAITKLAKYEDAEEQGVLKILPVAIDSDVYFIPGKTNYKLNVLNGYEQNNRVYHQRVANIVFDKRGWYLECDKNLEHGIDYILVDTFYKETWFTSKEEAEQALAEMKGV